MTKETKAKLVLIFVNLLFASALIVTKGLVDVYPMYLLTALRFLLASVCVAIMYHAKFKDIDKGTVTFGIIIGLVYIAGIICQTLGIKYTSAGRTSFLTAFYCILVPMVEWIVLKVKPKANKFVSAILGIVGVGLIVLSEKFTISAGDAFTLSAAIIFTAYLVLIDIYVKKFNPELFNFFLFLVCGIISLVLSFVIEGVPKNFSVAPLLGVLYLSVFCSAIPLVLQSKAQRVVDPTFVAIMVGPQAMFTTLFSVLLFHEVLTVKTVIGFVLIFIAVIVGAKN